MTDEPATTPAADNPWAIPDLTQAEKDDLMAALAEMRQPDPRVTALTLRCGQLREQRDEALRERDEARALDAYRILAERERDEARAQVVACQTAADVLREVDEGDVEAAKLLVELAREAGQKVDPAVEAIANALGPQIGACQCGRGPVVGVAFKRTTSLLVRRIEDVGHHAAADLRCADCIGDYAEEIAAAPRRGWHPDFGGPGMDGQGA